MKRTLVSMTDDMTTWLDAEASRRGCPVTQVIRDLVVEARRQRADLPDDIKAAIAEALRSTPLPRIG